MSGKKTGYVSLTLEQSQALHQNLMKRFFVLDHQDESEKQNQPLMKQHIQEIAAGSREREDSFQQLSAEFNQQIREIEAQTSLDIQQCQSDLAGELFNRTVIVEETLHGYLEEQAALFNQRILENHHRQQAQLTHLRRQLYNQSQSQKNLAAAAEEWISNTQNLIHFMDSHYRHAQFAPQKLPHLTADLDLAVQNAANGFYEASLATSQHVYRRASELRITLERDENLWNTRYAIAREACQQCLDSLEALEQAEFKPEDNGQSYPLDIDYWSKGKWAELKQEAGFYQTRLSSYPEQLSIEDLKTWGDSGFDKLADRIRQAGEEAVQAMIQSQVRTNIADLIMQALQNQGYQLNQAQFSGKDSRSGFEFQANSISGNAVRVFVNPGPSDKNEILLEAMDQKPLPEYLSRQRAAEISAALQKVGLQVDGFSPKTNPQAGPQTPITITQGSQMRSYAAH